jgi:hypothetical protein
MACVTDWDDKGLRFLAEPMVGRNPKTAISRFVSRLSKTPGVPLTDLVYLASDGPNSDQLITPNLPELLSQFHTLDQSDQTMLDRFRRVNILEFDTTDSYEKNRDFEKMYQQIKASLQTFQ